MSQKRDAAVIGAFGLLGGLLAWGFAFLTRPDVELWQIPIFVALGAGASLVFVVLVSNTDRTDFLRLISLSLLSGFFWEPVFQGGRALIERQQQARLVEEATSSIDAARALLASAGHDDGDPQILEQQIIDSVAEGNSAIRRLVSTREHRELERALTGLRVELARANPDQLPFARGVILASSAELASTAEAVSVPYIQTSARLAEKLSLEDRPTDVPTVESGWRYEPTGATRVWIRVNRDRSVAAVLQIDSETGQDLIARLVDAETLEVLSSDDDSGGALNPQLLLPRRTDEEIVVIESFDAASRIEAFGVELRNTE